MSGSRRIWPVAALTASILLSAGDVTQAGQPTLDEGTPIPVERQISFRREFGLRSDAAFVESLRASVSLSWGVPLTAAEEADLASRVRIQDALPPLKAALENMQGFGGIYIDQADGGTVVIEIADGRPLQLDPAVQALVPDGASLRFLSVQYSQAQLREIREVVRLRMVAGEAGLMSVKTSVRDNVVIVGVENVSGPLAESLRSEFGDAVQVESGSRLRNTACISRLECTPWRAGLRVTRTGGACTAAFMAKSGASWYWLTAGHCGGFNSLWWHDDAQAGLMTLKYYFQNSNGDAAAIKLSAPQQNWLYVTGGEPARVITSREGQEADTVGNSVCMSAYPTGFWCGVITNTDWSGEDENLVLQDKIRVATYCNEYGDSGGPVFYGNKAKGLNKGFFDGKPAPCSSAYTHIWEAERGLGVTVFTGN